MLYDVFICHAAEDKETFVHPLAEALQAKNVVVWYDAFSLKLGDSIRQSIDKGLAQSRFGVVVLSHAFFSKNWPQYELDGLAQREMEGNGNLILPIWHSVGHDDVKQYSLPLAGRKAARSCDGIAAVVDDILAVVHPEEGPLIIARDMLIERGMTPPVVSDPYWIAVAQDVYGLDHYRWHFPFPETDEGVSGWGQTLAWTAMQLNWIDTADEERISPLTHPSEVLAFIKEHPGLLETCIARLDWTAAYAPQLTIPGFGGELEEMFEAEYQKSLEHRTGLRRKNAIAGSGLTTDRQAPFCDVEWALRHPDFGCYEARHIAYAYFSGHEFGPEVSPYHGMDHAVWLLSKASDWLPRRVHSLLLEGMTQWITWPWGPYSRGRDRGGEWDSSGKLSERMFHALEKNVGFRWTPKAKDDTYNRIRLAKETLNLPETKDELFDLFVKRRFPQNFVQVEREFATRRDARQQKQGGADTANNSMERDS